MSNITLQAEGRRLYVVGNTFPIKTQIKEAGGHWDSDRKAWWVGTGKKEELQKAIASSVPPVRPDGERPNETAGDETEVRGKASYKGKNYYVICESRDGESAKLTSLDGKLVFWAKKANGMEITKRYQAREARSFYGRTAGRATYQTLGSIRRFIEEKKEVENGGECSTCARNFASGRWAPYMGSGDYDDCPQCGVTHQELR